MRPSNPGTGQDWHTGLTTAPRTPAPSPGRCRRRRRWRHRAGSCHRGSPGDADGDDGVGGPLGRADIPALPDLVADCAFLALGWHVRPLPTIPSRASAGTTRSELTPRPERSQHLNGRGKNISYTAPRSVRTILGLPGSISSPRRSRHLHVDDAVEYVLMDASGLQQLLARERPLRSLDEGNQQRVFALRQRHHGPRGSVSRRKRRSSCQPAKRQRPHSVPRGCDIRRRCRRRIARIRAEAPAGQTAWPNSRRPPTPARRRDRSYPGRPCADNRQAGGFRPDLRQQGEIVALTELQIQHHQVVAALGQMAGQFQPTCGRDRPDAVVPQEIDDRRPHLGVVVGDKNADRRVDHGTRIQPRRPGTTRQIPAYHSYPRSSQ